MATQRDLNAAFARGFRNQAAPIAAFTAGFDKVVDPVLKREEREREIARRQKLKEEAEAKQEKKRLDILAANSIGRVGANYNPEKVPAAMRPSLENFLRIKKEEAGKVALNLDIVAKQFGVNSPEYIDLQTQLSSKKNVFQAANQIAIDQQELTDEYIKNRQSASNGVAISRPGLLNKIQYVLDPNLQSYDIDWTNASDPTYFTPEGSIKHSELDDYYLKDSEFGGGFLKDATNIYNRAAAGKPMSAPERDAYRASIISSLEVGGEARMQSVLHDNLFEGFSLSPGIEAANYEQGINDPKLREAIADNMLGHYDNMSTSGSAQYDEKNNPSTYTPEDEARAKSLMALVNSGASNLNGGVGGTNIIMDKEGRYYPANNEGRKILGSNQLKSPEEIANRLRIPVTLYNKYKTN